MRKVLGIGFISIMVLGLSFIVLKLFAPASWAVHLQVNKWDCQTATFVVDNENPIAIIESKSAGGYRTTTIMALTVVDLNKKEIIGEFYKYSFMNVLGITPQKVWVYEDGDLLGLNVSNLEEEINVTEKLNKHSELNEKIDRIAVDGTQDELRIYSKDGYEYRYDSKLDKLSRLDSMEAIRPNLRTKDHNCGGNRTPDKINNVPILSAQWTKNVKNNCDAIFENGERLLQHNTLINEEGEFVLSRISADRIIWQLTEKAIKAKIDIENPQLRFSYLGEETCYLFFRGTGNVFLIEIDPETGEIGWHLELF